MIEIILITAIIITACVPFCSKTYEMDCMLRNLKENLREDG